MAAEPHRAFLIEIFYLFLTFSETVLTHGEFLCHPCDGQNAY